MDAAARRRRNGAFLQQRIAIERTGGARRGRCRSLHRVGARFWKRSERTRLSNRRARAGSESEISYQGECHFRSTLHAELAQTELVALDLADLETPFGAHPGSHL